MGLATYYYLVRSFFNRCPSYIIFFVTSRCNSRCRMCFYWKNIGSHSKKKELTLEEIKKISKNFKPFIYLTISGGEPFLRLDLPEIVETFVKNNKVQFVAIPTNALNTDKIVNSFEMMLKKMPNTSFRIILALDGIGALHDTIRGVKGNFKKFLQTYHKLGLLKKRYNNFNLDINTVLSSYNQNKILDIFKYVEENLKPDNHVLALVRGDTREKIARNISFEAYRKAAKLVESIATKKYDRRKGLKLKLLKTIKLAMRDIIYKTATENRAITNCQAGRKLVVISEDGDVYPCEMLNMKMGNLRESNYDIKKILFSKQSRNVKNWIKKTKCYCTFECAVQNSLIYNFRQYPIIIKKFLKTK